MSTLDLFLEPRAQEEPRCACGRTIDDPAPFAVLGFCGNCAQVEADTNPPLVMKESLK